MTGRKVAIKIVNKEKLSESVLQKVCKTCVVDRSFLVVTIFLYVTLTASAKNQGFVTPASHTVISQIWPVGVVVIKFSRQPPRRN